MDSQDDVKLTEPWFVIAKDEESSSGWMSASNLSAITSDEEGNFAVDGQLAVVFTTAIRNLLFGRETSLLEVIHNVSSSTGANTLSI